ncbi:MAG: hypothetical protein A2033_09755 [Bacteroidetes bacterium GWA2_31_9]|nr:MAG: hypothetical protein A2033_09755 [Bacteroidetes bacterium GWA2_31_9]
MNTLNINPPLTNVQVALLNLFATHISDENLVELKNLMAKFLLEKARDKADIIWKEKGFNEQTIKSLLNDE